MLKDELAEIFTKHGSDKWNSHWYAGPYATHFGEVRDETIKLLEIGVGGYDNPRTGGHSLRAWKEFFPSAEILGLDYYDKSKIQEDRIKIYCGSQTDPLIVSSIMNDSPEGFDIIIDDGSHRSEHVIKSFFMLWPAVKEDGWYVIEDLQTSYWPDHGGRLSDDRGLTTMSFLKILVDGLNWQEMHQPTYAPSEFDRTVVGIHFYHNIVFLKKGTNEGGSTQVIDNRIAGI